MFKTNNHIGDSNLSPPEADASTSDPENFESSFTESVSGVML